MRDQTFRPGSLDGSDFSADSIRNQVARLTELLNGKGIKTAALNFPNRTTDTGAVINAYLQSGKELGQPHPGC